MFFSEFFACLYVWPRDVADGSYHCGVRYTAQPIDHEGTFLLSSACHLIKDDYVKASIRYVLHVNPDQLCAAF